MAVEQITFTKGDTVSFAVILKRKQTPEEAGIAIDLTGAVFETTFPGETTPTVVIPNSAHTKADQTVSPGKLTIALTSVNTSAIRTCQDDTFIVKMTQGGSTIHFHGTGLLNVLSNSVLG